MKSRNIFFLGVSILLMLVFIVYNFTRQSINDDVSLARDIIGKNTNMATDQTSNSINDQRLVTPTDANGFDSIAFKMSQEICRQEREALWQITEPKIPHDTPIGTEIPLDSEVTLSASQAIDWLKKTNTSTCFSFRKNNAERLFYNFVVDEKNYKLFHQEHERVLQEYRGFAPYRLIRKALKTLDGETKEDEIPLREAILSSLDTYINDASAPVDIIGAFLAVKDVREKGLIPHLTKEQIDTLENEFSKANQLQISKHQQLIKKFLPLDSNKLTNLSLDAIAEAYGYVGTKLLRDLEQEDYDTIRGFSHKLHSLVVVR